VESASNYQVTLQDDWEPPSLRRRSWFRAALKAPLPPRIGQLYRKASAKPIASARYGLIVRSRIAVHTNRPKPSARPTPRFESDSRTKSHHRAEDGTRHALPSPSSRLVSRVRTDSSRFGSPHPPSADLSLSRVRAIPAPRLPVRPAWSLPVCVHCQWFGIGLSPGM
jgi:hypothetical protein